MSKKTITFNGHRLQIQRSEGTQTKALNSPQTELPTYTIKGSKKQFTPTGEVLLVFKTVPTETEWNQLLEEHPITFVKRYTSTRIAAKIVEGTDVIDYVPALEAIEGIESVEVDLESEPDLYSLVPSDDLFLHQWHLQNNGVIPDFEDAHHFMEAGADAKVLEAWNELGDYGSTEAIIAVSDNGFDLRHPDFAGAGKIVHPLNLFYPDRPIFDGNSTNKTHGTPCAGIALASANGTGTVGVCPNAHLMPIEGTGNGLETLRKIVDYCIDKNVAVLSMSWGENTDWYYPLSPERIHELNRLLREGRNGKGTVVVIAAGNDYKYRLNYLATHPNVIAVGATTSQDFHACYSNIGEEITVCAPGGGWPLIAPKATWANPIWDGNAHDTTRSQFDKYTHFTGTSGATPLVAGIGALILSANPNLTADEVKRIIVNTTDKVGHPTEYSSIGHSVRYGFGRVNALKAVQMAKRAKLGEAIPAIPTPRIQVPIVDVGEMENGATLETEVNVGEEIAEELDSRSGAFPQDARVVNLRTGSTLNVRFDPKVLTDNISRTLKKGDKVRVKGKANEKWYELASEYVHANFLEIGGTPQGLNVFDPKNYLFELPQNQRPAIADSNIPEAWYPDIKDFLYLCTGERTSQDLEHITTLVIHATAGASSEGAISVMKAGDASFHWLVPDENEEGHEQWVWACAGEKKKAWHVRNAATHPDINNGNEGINDVSLSIEVVNVQNNADPFSDWQVRITAQIARYCWAKYPNLKHIVSHAALDSHRRTDPGTHFPWESFKTFVLNGVPTTRGILTRLPTDATIKQLVKSAKDIEVDPDALKGTCWEPDLDI